MPLQYLKKLLCLLALTSIQIAGASNSLVQSHSASDEEYLSYLAAHPRFVSLSELELKKVMGRSNNKNVIQLLESAQEFFLSAQLHRARKAFQEIIALKEERQTSEEERKTITYALFRLAQLAESEEGKRQLLTEAYVYNPNYQPDENLFPPPLLSQWTKVKSRHIRFSWRPLPWMQNYSLILINGRKYFVEPGLQIDLPVGSHLLTFVSNKSRASTHKLSTSQLDLFRPPYSPLGQGTCQTHKLMAPQLSTYFADDCIISPKNQVSYQKSATIPRLTDPIARAPKVTSTAWYKNKWLWGGLIASSVAIYLNQPNPKHYIRPTHNPGSVARK